jgi:hypothetical protein
VLFDSPMMAMGGANAFSPDAFTPSVSQTPIDAPLFQAFTSYLRDESTLEGIVASELVNGGSASGAVQKLRTFIENNPDDPEAIRLTQLLPPEPFDPMADPEAPSPIDWSEAGNIARRFQEQYHAMPAAQRALLPQVLDPNAAPGAEVPTEEGTLSLGVDEMGNPVIMQTTVTPTEQAQKFTDMGLSLPTDTYETEDFLPAEWEAQQQNHLNVVQPAVEQAMQNYLGTRQVEPLGAEQLAGQPSAPYEYAPDRQQADAAQQAVMMAIAKMLHDPNQIVSIAGRGAEAAGNAGNAIIGANEAIYGGTADALGELLGPFSGAWQTAGGGGGFPDLGIGNWFEGAEGGAEGQQWLDERNQEEALRQVQQILQAQQLGGQAPPSNAQDGGGGGGLFGNVWDALTGGSSVGAVPGGDEAWNRIAGDQAPPMQVDYGSSPATYEELLAQLGFPTGEGPGPERPRAVTPGGMPPYVYGGSMPGPERPRGVEPGATPPYVYGGSGPEPMTMALLTAILGQQPGAQPANQPGGPAYMEEYRGRQAQPANQPGGPAYMEEYRGRQAEPANQPGGPAYMSQFIDTGEDYDPLSSATTGERKPRSGAPEGRPTRTRAGQGGHQLLLRGQSQQRVRDRAHDDWISAFESGIRSQQATYGRDFGAALAQSRMAQQSGVTPYQQEMAMRRMVASALGYPTGGYPGV